MLARRQSEFSPYYLSKGNTNVNVGNGNINNSFNNDQINIINVNSPGTVSSMPPTAYYPPQQAPSYYPQQQAVAANETATIWGDPHIDPAHVQKDPNEKPRDQYNFMDSGTYNLLTDRNVYVNGTFSGSGSQAPDPNDPNADPNNPNGGGGVTTMSEAGITIGGDQLKCSAKDGKLMINGQDASKGLQFANGTTVESATDDKNNTGGKSGIIIKNSNCEYNFNIDCSGSYLNLKAISKNQGVMSDGVAPSGILGETFNHDDSDVPPDSGDTSLPADSPTDTNQDGKADPSQDTSSKKDNDQKNTRYSHDHYKVQSLFAQLAAA